MVGYVCFDVYLKIVAALWNSKIVEVVEGNSLVISWQFSFFLNEFGKFAKFAKMLTFYTKYPRLSSKCS